MNPTEQNARESARVLLVEDDEKTRDLLAGFLASAGHECIAVPTGTEAIALCKSMRFDCMILDVVLEGPSGLAVAQRLGGNESGIRPTRVFLLSGKPKADFADALRQGWADGHILKPVVSDELDAIVRASLRPTPPAP